MLPAGFLGKERSLNSRLRVCSRTPGPPDGPNVPTRSSDGRDGVCVGRGRTVADPGYSCCPLNGFWPFLPHAPKPVVHIIAPAVNFNRGSVVVPFATGTEARHERPERGSRAGSRESAFIGFLAAAVHDVAQCCCPRDPIMRCFIGLACS